MPRGRLEHVLHEGQLGVRLRFASFGVDARIGSTQVGIVPTLRIYVTKNRSVNETVYPGGGAERLTIAPGVGVQMYL